MEPVKSGLRITISGTVQGVGFRPFVWRLARSHQLIGSVQNSPQGVNIEAWGEPSQLTLFTQRLSLEAPPLAEIIALNSQPIHFASPLSSFEILPSSRGHVSTLATDDVALCEACVAEIFDRDNRRFRYPFTNCTECGPRLSIIRRLPYDRDNTSMQPFSQCQECLAEYHEPRDRRFHAQPNCCSHCGPRLWLQPAVFDAELPQNDVIALAAQLLQEGKLLAIKSLGGFRLTCSALNEEAVARLRTCKHRPDKPLALMARNLAMVADYALVSDAEKIALRSTVNPIVLLKRLANTELAKSIAPDQNHLGFMLPGTALEHILLADLDVPLVMTSGNVSGEVQIIDNVIAQRDLAEAVDFFLLHDRDIVRRLDDSVVRVLPEPMTIRRARGLCGKRLPLPTSLNAAIPVLAMGADLKNTFCLVRQDGALLSSHMGDLADGGTVLRFKEFIADYLALYGNSPKWIAVDQHRDYVSTQIGQQLALELGCRVFAVQHHHAHVAAVMAEHNINQDEQVLGVVFDGLGMGVDGELWGGEFLLANYRTFKRFARLQPVPLPGGARAMKEPWRNLLAHLEVAGLSMELKGLANSLACMERLTDYRSEILLQAVKRGLNSPMASSCGRLFDAVAAALCVGPETITFEGQAALLLENTAQSEFDRVFDHYPVNIKVGAHLNQVEWRAFWQALFLDLQRGVNKTIIAAKFHRTLIAITMQALILQRSKTAVNKVVLAGGVFQNTLLLRGLRENLMQTGFEIFAAEKLPCHDGGLAFGQAMIALSVPGDK